MTMAPKKPVPSPPVIFSPSPPVDPEKEARLKAEARAYALSGSSSSGTKRKSPPNGATNNRQRAPYGSKKAAHHQATMQQQQQQSSSSPKPTTLNIHRPVVQQQRKLPVPPKHSPTVVPPRPTPTTTAQQNNNRVVPYGAQPLTTSSVVPPSQNLPLQMPQGGDEDYFRFVKSLGLDDSFFTALDNDDEDFHLSDAEDNDEDDDDFDEDMVDMAIGGQTMNNSGNDNKDGGLAGAKVDSTTPTLSSPLCSSPVALPDFESDMFRELDEELGNLLEEDMEAAVQSLMTSKKPTSPLAETPKKSATKKQPQGGAKGSAKKGADNKNANGGAAATVGAGETPTTPLRDAARQGTSAVVSYQQSQQLRRLLTRHYQLLVQQSILAVRAAHTQKTTDGNQKGSGSTKPSDKSSLDFLSGETADDLAEILDQAVGMLQDLDQNRRDAIRNSIQLAETNAMDGIHPAGRRSLFHHKDSGDDDEYHQSNDRRLTRSAFSRTLQQSGGRGIKRTTFDIPGLVKLNETFASIDSSVQGIKPPGSSILGSPNHTEACKMVLKQAGANVDDSFVPGTKDLADNFCDCREFFGQGYTNPPTAEQEMALRKNRNLFTSGEDNLVLRGVNLYGEKQWILIADRYLPDRSVNIISQRYSKLCVMLYRAHGIHIAPNGNLLEPPKLESVDDIDDEQVKKLALTKVAPPAILNVHRWSLEEDLTLLKAVPIMGHMWAELGARLIPHRDRGHLRKRYQVLERRVKATVTRNAKETNGSLSGKKSYQPRGKNNNPAVYMKPPTVKSSAKAKLPVKPVKAMKPPTMAKQVKPPTVARAVKPAPVKKAVKPKVTARSGKVAAAAKKVAPTRTKLPAAAMSIDNAAAALAALKPQNKPVATDAAKAAASLAALRPGLKKPEAAAASMAYPTRPAPRMPVPGIQAPPPVARTSAPSQPNSRPAGPKKTTGTAQPVAPAKRPAGAVPVSRPSGSVVNSKRSGQTVPATKASAAKASSRSKAPLARRLSPRKRAAAARSPPRASAAEMDSLQQPFANDASTRMAFEKLIEGTSEEWSQMSRMKKMMENEDESEAADAIVTHLAKSPVSNGLSKLPNLELDSNSMSGLSMLQSEASRQIFPENDSTPEKQPGGDRKSRSIMSKVLENSRSSQGDKKPTEISTGAKFESPRKRPASGNKSSLMMSPPPTTPKRGRFFSTAGTPLVCSPTFRPGGGRAGSLALTPNRGGLFSPNPNSLLRMVDGEPSIDGIKLGDFDLPEESRIIAAGVKEEEKVAEQQTQQQKHDPTPPPLTPSKNSLLPFHTTEADPDAMLAISALEMISNSPARVPKKKKVAEEEKKEKSPPRSLFAKVIGNATNKDAKKKLQF